MSTKERERDAAIEREVERMRAAFRARHGRDPDEEGEHLVRRIAAAKVKFGVETRRDQQ